MQEKERLLLGPIMYIEYMLTFCFFSLNIFLQIGTCFFQKHTYHILSLLLSPVFHFALNQNYVSVLLQTLLKHHLDSYVTFHSLFYYYYSVFRHLGCFQKLYNYK